VVQRDGEGAEVVVDTAIERGEVRSHVMRWVKQQSGLQRRRARVVVEGRRSLSLGIGGPNLVSAGQLVELAQSRVVAPPAGAVKDSKREIPSIGLAEAC
jgi:hypothetical protein